MPHELPSKIVPPQFNLVDLERHFPNIVDSTIFTPEFVETIFADKEIEPFSATQPKAYLIKPLGNNPVTVRLPMTGLRNGSYISFFDASENGNEKPDLIVGGSEDIPIVHTIVKNQRIEFVWVERTREWFTYTSKTNIRITHLSSTRQNIIYDLNGKIRDVSNFVVFGNNVDKLIVPIGESSGDYHIQIGNYTKDSDMEYQHDEFICNLGPMSHLDEFRVNGEYYFTDRFGSGAPYHDRNFTSIGPITQNHQNIVHDGIPGYLVNDDPSSPLVGTVYRDRLIGDMYSIDAIDGSAKFGLAQGCSYALEATDPYVFWNVFRFEIPSTFAGNRIDLNINQRKWASLHLLDHKSLEFRNATPRDVTITFFGKSIVVPGNGGRGAFSMLEQYTQTLAGNQLYQFVSTVYDATITYAENIQTNAVTAANAASLYPTTVIQDNDAHQIIPVNDEFIAAIAVKNLEELIFFPKCTVNIPRFTSLMSRDADEFLEGRGNSRIKVSAEIPVPYYMPLAIDDSYISNDIYNRNVNVFLAIRSNSLGFYTSIYDRPVVNGEKLNDAILVGGFFYGEMMVHTSDYNPVYSITSQNLNECNESPQGHQLRVYTVGILENSIYDVIRRPTAENKNSVDLKTGESIMKRLVKIGDTWCDIYPRSGECRALNYTGVYPLREIDVDNDGHDKPITNISWYNMIEVANYFNMRLPSVLEAMNMVKDADMRRDEPISVFGVRIPKNMRMATDNACDFRGNYFAEIQGYFPESEVGKLVSQPDTKDVKVITVSAGDYPQGNVNTKLGIDGSNSPTYLRLCCGSTI